MIKYIHNKVKESDFLYFFIKGNLEAKDNGFIVVENSGIGYKISVSDNTMSSLTVNTQVTVYTHLYVREDIVELYGFSSLDEKNMFLNLISVSGVGPKAAMAVLSLGAPAKIAAAVIKNDAKFIQKASGIGAKTAQRIILDLHDKINTENLEIPDDTEVVVEDKNKLSEAVSALTVLGYSDREAASAIKGIDLSLDTEEIIKLALKNMLKGV